MAKKSRATFQKREKERARQQKQHDKAQRRVAAKAQRASSAPRLEDESWKSPVCPRATRSAGVGRDRAGCMAQAASYPVVYTGCVWRDVLHEFPALARPSDEDTGRAEAP